MLDFLDRGCFLKKGILKEKTIHEAAMNIDINVLVDGGGNKEPAVLPIVGRQVSPASSERNSQWSARNNHALVQS